MDDSDVPVEQLVHMSQSQSASHNSTTSVQSIVMNFNSANNSGIVHDPYYLRHSHINHV